MARLTQKAHEDDASRRPSPEHSSPTAAVRWSRPSRHAANGAHRASKITLVPKTATPTQQHKQIRLVPLQNLGYSGSLANSGDLGRALIDAKSRPARRPHAQLRAPLKRSTAPPTLSIQDHSDAESFKEEGGSDGKESSWCASVADSDSDEDLPSPRLFLRSPAKSAAVKVSNPLLSNPPRHAMQIEALSIYDDEDEACESRPRTGNIHGGKRTVPRPGSSSDKENDAIVHYSPPRLKSPGKRKSYERPVTPPPASPSKSKLLSPSKKLARVPIEPSRPSLDAFWELETVNNWNDQYSPKKTVKSPKKLLFLPESTLDTPASPQKPQSPYKRTKAELEVRKDFNDRKVRLAQSFLAELDRTVTQGQIQELAAATGGVDLVWSKTLNSTAGRAKWRRETTKTRAADGAVTATAHRHFASIELAEKVIDDEHRLLNVLAHEFCHLANFMVSNVKDQPHGAQFKAWGRACSLAFAARGVHVTTKHSYEIEYKYIWQCRNPDCAVEYRRHSKSIDPTKHTCGKCRTSLAQVKPVPRKAAAAAGSGSLTPDLASSSSSSSQNVDESRRTAAAATAPTGYAAFVKLHFAAVKRGLPGASHKAVMEALGRKYRAEKETVAAAKLGMGGGPGNAASDGALIDLLTPSAGDDKVDEITRAVQDVALG